MGSAVMGSSLGFSVRSVWVGPEWKGADFIGEGLRRGCGGSASILAVRRLHPIPSQGVEAACTNLAAAIRVDLCDHVEKLFIRGILAHRCKPTRTMHPSALRKRSGALWVLLTLQHCPQLPVTDGPTSILVKLAKCIAARLDLLVGQLHGRCALVESGLTAPLDPSSCVVSCLRLPASSVPRIPRRKAQILNSADLMRGVRTHHAVRFQDA